MEDEMHNWLRGLFVKRNNADSQQANERGSAWYNGYRSYFAAHAPNPYPRNSVNHCQWNSGFESADESCAC